MDLKTFKADTMVEALNQVKSVMGSDAVILHTRTFQTRRWLGLRRREVVEITAGRGFNVGARSRRQQQQATPRPTPAINTYSRSGLVQRAPNQLVAPDGESMPPLSAADNSRQLLESPAASSAVLLGINQEMATLKGMVKDLICQNRAKSNPNVPEELFEYYMQLTDNQVDPELATDIIRALHKQVRPEHLLQPEFVRERLADQIEKLLPVGGPIVRTKTSSPHIIALIGPTGVGKTTTLAKLAANFKLREKHRVGLITLDTYRIAAVDQLRKYADIIGSPLKVVNGIEELREAMGALSNCEYILIDTAGRSPNDALKLNELKGLLAAIEPDDVHLVLSTTASQACLKLAVERFSDVRVDKLIFTKLDEAAHVGVVLNIVRQVGKSLSYVTTGQDVPDDIEVGRGRRLAQLILGESL
jgi:flagellar biosynthesis protein FlhF